MDGPRHDEPPEGASTASNHDDVNTAAKSLAANGFAGQDARLLSEKPTVALEVLDTSSSSSSYSSGGISPSHHSSCGGDVEPSQSSAERSYVLVPNEGEKVMMEKTPTSQPASSAGPPAGRRSPETNLSETHVEGKLPQAHVPDIKQAASQVLDDSGIDTNGSQVGSQVEGALHTGIASTAFTGDTTAVASASAPIESEEDMPSAVTVEDTAGLPSLSLPTPPQSFDRRSQTILDQEYVGHPGEYPHLAAPSRRPNPSVRDAEIGQRMWKQGQGARKKKPAHFWRQQPAVDTRFRPPPTGPPITEDWSMQGRQDQDYGPATQRGTQPRLLLIMSPPPSYYDDYQDEYYPEDTSQYSNRPVYRYLDGGYPAPAADPHYDCTDELYCPVHQSPQRPRQQYYMVSEEQMRELTQPHSHASPFKNKADDTGSKTPYQQTHPQPDQRAGQGQERTPRHTHVNNSRTGDMYSGSAPGLASYYDNQQNRRERTDMTEVDQKASPMEDAQKKGDKEQSHYNMPSDVKKLLDRLEKDQKELQDSIAAKQTEMSSQVDLLSQLLPGEQIQQPPPASSPTGRQYKGDGDDEKDAYQEKDQLKEKTPEKDVDDSVDGNTAVKKPFSGGDPVAGGQGPGPVKVDVGNGPFLTKVQPSEDCTAAAAEVGIHTVSNDEAVEIPSSRKENSSTANQPAGPRVKEITVQQGRGHIRTIEARPHNHVTGLTYVPQFNCLCFTHLDNSDLYVYMEDEEELHWYNIPRLKNPSGMVALKNNEKVLAISDFPERRLHLVTLTKAENGKVAVDQEKHRIWKLPFKPADVSLFRDDMLLLTSMNDDTLNVFRYDGKQMGSISIKGVIVERLYSATAVDNKTFAAADMTDEDGKVMWVGADGKVFRQYTGKETGPGLIQPIHIILDMEGRHLVADQKNHIIHLLNQDGKCIQQLLQRSDGLILPRRLLLDTSSGRHRLIIGCGPLGCIEVRIYDYHDLCRSPLDTDFADLFKDPEPERLPEPVAAPVENAGLLGRFKPQDAGVAMAIGTAAGAILVGMFQIMRP